MHTVDKEDRCIWPTWGERCCAKPDKLVYIHLQVPKTYRHSNTSTGLPMAIDSSEYIHRPHALPLSPSFTHTMLPCLPSLTFQGHGTLDWSPLAPQSCGALGGGSTWGHWHHSSGAHSGEWKNSGSGLKGVGGRDRHDDLCTICFALGSYNLATNDGLGRTLNKAKSNNNE